MTLNTEKHWENVYESKEIDKVSWYQENCTATLDMIRQVPHDGNSSIIDVGSGATQLISSLLSMGQKNITALDISKTALSKAKAQLGQKADKINWVHASITTWSPDKVYDLWHDRAVYHFLTEEADRKAYVSTLKKALKKGGTLIISSFGLDGPEKCSNLPVRRHSPEMFDEELGPEFKRVECRTVEHETPWSSTQQFVYCRYQRL